MPREWKHLRFEISKFQLCLLTWHCMHYSCETHATTASSKPCINQSSSPLSSSSSPLSSSTTPSLFHSKLKTSFPKIFSPIDTHTHQLDWLRGFWLFLFFFCSTVFFLVLISFIFSLQCHAVDEAGYLSAFESTLKVISYRNRYAAVHLNDVVQWPTYTTLHPPAASLDVTTGDSHYLPIDLMTLMTTRYRTRNRQVKYPTNTILAMLEMVLSVSV